MQDLVFLNSTLLPVYFASVPNRQGKNDQSFIFY